VPGANQFDGVGKRRFAERVLRVEMRADDIQLIGPAQSGRNPAHRLAVSRTQTGVDDQRRSRADDDADIGDETDVEIRDHVHVVGHLADRGFADQRIGGRGLRRREGKRQDRTRP